MTLRRPRLRESRLGAAIVLNCSPMPAGIGCTLREAPLGWQAAAAQPVRSMRHPTPASPTRATWLAQESAYSPRP
jgi:hypothetical protein